MYISNTTDRDIPVGPCEIFGFNVGGFVERLTSEARSARDGILWKVMNDAEILITDSEGGKKPMPLSNLICSQAQENGIVDMDVQEYNLNQICKAGSG